AAYTNISPRPNRMAVNSTRAARWSSNFMTRLRASVARSSAVWMHHGWGTQLWRSGLRHINQEEMMPRHRGTRRYSRKASSQVRTEMRHMKSGKHKIKSRKQAIAIGLSKARQKGAKVPRKKSR